MKREVNPVMIVVAVVIVLVLLGGLYYKFLGPGSDQKSDVASPYMKPFAMPAGNGSGRNGITGEPLPNRPGRQMMTSTPGTPVPPAHP